MYPMNTTVGDTETAPQLQTSDIQTPHERLMDLIEGLDIALAAVDDEPIRGMLKLKVNRIEKLAEILKPAPAPVIPRIAIEEQTPFDIEAERAAMARIAVVKDKSRSAVDRLEAADWLLSKAYGLALPADIRTGVFVPDPSLVKHTADAVSNSKAYLKVRLDQVEDLVTRIAGDDPTGLTPARLDFARDLIEQVREGLS